MEFPHVTFHSSPSGSRPGPTSWQLHKGYKNGSLVRIRHGVYVPAEQWLTGSGWDRYAWTTASLAVSGRSPVFCRETGLMLWGLSLPLLPRTVDYQTRQRSHCGLAPAGVLYGNRAEVTSLKNRVAPALHGLPSGFRDMRRLGSDPGLHTVEAPSLGLLLRVQDFDALLAESVHRMTFPDAVTVLDQVVRRGNRRTWARSPEQLIALAEALPKGAWRQRMMNATAFADPLAESVGESFSRAVIRQLGFEVPDSQYWVMDGAERVGRTDFRWRGRKLVGEFDGLMKYTRARELSGKDPGQVVAEEKIREDRIRALGFDVVRWTWDELRKPERLAARLLRAGVPRHAGY